MTAGPPESSPKRGSGLSQWRCAALQLGEPKAAMARRTVLLLLALWLGQASIAHAQSPVQFSCRDDFAGLIDGNVVQPAAVERQARHQLHHPQLPGRNEHELQFDNNDPTPYLVIFDNVVHTGQMSCNALGGPQDLVHEQLVERNPAAVPELFIPVEKIDKQSPGPYASHRRAVHLPAHDSSAVRPASGRIIVDDQGSANDLHSDHRHGRSQRDRRSADATSVTPLSGRTTARLCRTTFSNVGGLLTFSGFPLVPADRQMLIEHHRRARGRRRRMCRDAVRQHGASGQFGRFIDGVFYQPLPGEWGITPPMTIAAPNLVVDKSGTTVLGGTSSTSASGRSSPSTC